jgi:spore coat protein CotH
MMFAAAVAWSLLAWVTPAAAQTSADLFNNQKLHEIRLSINSRDLVRLRAGYLENTYYPADLQWQGLRIRNVGVRSRGTGSRNASKLGLLVQFDRYAKTQQFLGLTELVLDNSWQDPSLMREALAMSVYRRMGQAAPREAFCRVYINNEFQGLYSMVEPVDTAFTQRALSQSNGYLYEYHYQGPWYTEYLGDALDPYKAMFEPQNHKRESDSELYVPLRDLFREANGPDDAVWRERLDRYLDLPEFMTHIAIEDVLTENDGILGFAGVNNFYLYRNQGTTQHRLLPWDKDFSFTFLEISILRRGLEDFPLFARAWGQPDLRSHFLDVAEQCAHVIGDDDWLAGEIERIVALITPSVIEDTRKQFTTEQFVADIDFLRTFASVRAQSVLNEVQSLR